MYARIVSLAAIGALALGIAACGKSTAKPANADTVGTASAGTTTNATASPDPATSKAPLPDPESCRSSTNLLQLVGSRLVHFKQGVQIDPSAHVNAVRVVPDMVTHAAQVKAAILDARVKAVVEQYQTDLEHLKGKVDAAGEDRAKHAAAFEEAVAKHDKAAQNLSALCAETLANDGGRAPTCKRAGVIFANLSGTLATLDAAGADLGKQRAEAQNFLKIADAAGPSLSTVADQSTDPQLRTAISRMVMDLNTLRHAVASGRPDGPRIERAVDTVLESKKAIDRLCEG